MSDTGLAIKVKAALIAEDTVGAGGINVSAANGIITLQGTVANHAQAKLAEAIARRQGAIDVVNELELADPSHQPPPSYVPDDFHVTTPEGAPPSDRLLLERGVHEALVSDPAVNADLVQVSVRGDTVYLDGRQDTVQARDAATAAASQVPGIVTVINNLEIRSSI